VELELKKINSKAAEFAGSVKKELIDYIPISNALIQCSERREIKDGKETEMALTFTDEFDSFEDNYHGKIVNTSNPGIVIMFPSVFFVESYANKIHQRRGAPL